MLAYPALYVKHTVFILLSLVPILADGILHTRKFEGQASEKPKIAFSFDDGSVQDMPGYPLKSWNQLLLDALHKHQIKAVLFASGHSLPGIKGKYILNSWNGNGHKIGNHTFFHRNYNQHINTPLLFESDLIRNDSMIHAYSNYYPYFRFPYLKEGNTQGKIDSIRTILKRHHYHHGHVTIDASDWYVNSRLITRLKKDPASDLSGIRQFYLDHLMERAIFYDSLALRLTHRKINHVILLHHNLAAALFLNDLIEHFKSRGWDVVDIESAYHDPVYELLPAYIPAGESLIWALAKQSGKFDHVLRYPAEDGDYEKIKMDKLGL